MGSRLMASTRPSVARALGALALAAFLVGPTSALRAQNADPAADPVVARANGVDIRQSDLALAEDEVGANMPQMGPDQKRDYLITYLADVIVLAQAAEQQKLADRDDVKHRVQFERNKVLMETLLQDAGTTAMTDDAMHKVYDDAVKQMANEQEVHARHILVADRGRSQGDRRPAEKGRRLRHARQGKVEGSGRCRRRRSRLFHQGPDGAGIRRRRVQARQGSDFRSGADAVRLAHHQGRRQAHQADADLR